jgi:hypothetical protein
VRQVPIGQKPPEIRFSLTSLNTIAQKAMVRRLQAMSFWINLFEILDSGGGLPGAKTKFTRKKHTSLFEIRGISFALIA